MGICPASGASAPLTLTSVRVRATRQPSLGSPIGVAMAVVLDLWSGDELMGGVGLLVVPGTAVFMLVVLVVLVAASGPAPRRLRVQPTEALRAE